MSYSKEITIVIPCYNSSKSILELNSRLVQVLRSLGISYEVIYINDNSTDDTLEILKSLAKLEKNLIVIDLMNNVGQFKALMCGFEYSSGKYVITMDDDLQHPPEEIEKLYKFIKQNKQIDVVIGSFTKKKHSFVRNIGSLLVRKLNEKIFNKPKNIKMSAFRILNRSLVETIISHKTMFPVIGPLINKSTSKIANVEIQHEKRKYGKSNYSIIKLMKITLDHVINFSSLPLKYISLLGVFTSIISFIIALYYFVKYFIGEISLPGWTSIILLLNFYGGLILLSIGLIGEYLIRILSEVNGAPRYRIRTIYKFQSKSKDYRNN